MVVAGRLEKKNDASSGALAVRVGDGDAAVAPAAAAVNTDIDVATAPLPVLPIDMWFHAMSFFRRSWWAVNE